MSSDNKKSPDRPVVEVRKTFNASPEKGFNAWLDTGMIGRWMFGADIRNEEIIHLANNIEVGGTFSYVVRREGEDLDHRGTYRVIDRPNTLDFTWGVNEEAGDESVVSIHIKPTENGCELTLVHSMDPKWEEYTERTREGWTHMLDKLKTILNNE